MTKKEKFILGIAPYLFIILCVVFAGCLNNKNVTGKFDKIKDLDYLIKDYGFVPFKIPRNGDGVCTIITFSRNSEAVVASKTDCLANILVDTLNNSIPEFSYTITPNDSAGVDFGNIFGAKFNLKGAFKYEKIKKISVKLLDPFEARFTRVSIEKEINKILKSDPVCTKNLYSKSNFLIERVFGAHGIEITLQDSASQTISADINILKNITFDPDLQKKYNGKATLKTSTLTLLGYRVWQFNANPGFDGAETKHNELDIAATIDLRTKSNN